MRLTSGYESYTENSHARSSETLNLRTGMIFE